MNRQNENTQTGCQEKKSSGGVHLHPYVLISHYSEIFTSHCFRKCSIIRSRGPRRDPSSRSATDLNHWQSFMHPLVKSRWPSKKVNFFAFPRKPAKTTTRLMTSTFSNWTLSLWRTIQYIMQQFKHSHYRFSIRQHNLCHFHVAPN